MVFYLDNGDMFLIYVTYPDVIFVLFSATTLAPLGTSVRWKNGSIFNQEHLIKIIMLLKSKDIVDTRIGKTMLEQSLKVKIHGEITGYRETNGAIKRRE